MGVKGTFRVCPYICRQNTGLSIYRQKQYHDRKTSHEKLEVNDKVYVLFPVKQVGQSSKFCSFWRGPYQIKEKLCEVLIVVNCGRNYTHQVVHIDRLKLARSQILSGEVEINDSPEREEFAETHRPNDSVISREKDAELLEEDFSRFGRQRRKPVWFKDYVSSLFREKLPLLKTTPRKAIEQLCHYCKKHIGPEESFGTHMEICYNKRFQCDTCGQHFKEKTYLKTHQKRKHSVEIVTASKVQPKEKTEESSTSSSDNNEKEGNNSDWDHEPDFNIGEELNQRKVSDIHTGRLYRKPCDPKPVMAPVKKSKVSATITSGEPCKDEHIISTEVDNSPSDQGSSRKKIVEESNKVVVEKIERKVQQETVSKMDTSVAAVSRFANQTDKTVLSNKGKLEIDFAVKGDGRTKQTLRVVKDEEEMLSSSSVNIGTISASDISFNLADFLGQGVLDPRDVQLHIQKERIIMKVDKRQL